MAESPNRRKEIFLKSLDLSPAEGAALLAQECADGAPLRLEIEAMLQAHEKPDSFLEKPAAAMEATIDGGTAPPMAAVLPDAFLGTRIGP